MLSLNVIVDPNLSATTGLSQQYIDNSVNTLHQAAAIWNRYLDINVTLNVDFDIRTLPNNVAAQASSRVYTDENGVVGSEALNIIQGGTPTSSSVGEYRMSVDLALADEYFFSTNLDWNDNVPANTIDTLHIATHELGHILGFNSLVIPNFLDENDVFTGTETGSVQFFNDAHIYDFEALMGPVVSTGERYPIKSITVDIMDDIGHDVFRPTSGNDVLFGFNLADDIIYTGSGNDIVNGLSGNDILVGESGNDHLIGDQGSDYMVGGTDSDLYEGGIGNDVFSFDSSHMQSGIFDTINNFNSLTNDYDYIGFTNLTSNDLVLADYQGDAYITTTGLGFTGGIVVEDTTVAEISDQLLFF